MKNRRLGRKGGLFSWLTILLMLFVVMVVYVAFDNIVRNELYDVAVNDTGVDVTLMDNLVSVWTAFPFVFLFCLLIFGLYTSQRRDSDVLYP